MPHHAFKRRSRTAWLLLMAAAAGLAGCSGNGSYRVSEPWMAFDQVLSAIYSNIRNDFPEIPDPDEPDGFILRTDPSDPAQKILSALEPKGDVWIFPARESTQELRVHFVRYPQNLDGATYFDVHVEVKTPYTVSIDGAPFEVTQESATKILNAAFDQVVDRLNGESTAERDANAGGEGEPVVTALRQLVPWAKVHSVKRRYHPIRPEERVTRSNAMPGYP